MKEVSRSIFIEQNMGLVGMVVKGFYNRITNYSHVDWEDLRNIGVIGLINAYDRFDPSYGFKFTTYAVPMIRGEIQSFLRDNLDAVKFSRKIKENYYKIVECNLTNESPGIIAAILEIPIGHAEEALAYHRGQYHDSLDREVFKDDGAPISLGDMIGDETDFDSNMIVNDFLKQFDDYTQTIMKLRLQNMSQVEVGKKLNISQAQVSRVLLAAKKQLEEGGIQMSRDNKRDFNLAKRLAIETELNGYEISEKTGISSVTAYKYINAYRVPKEEINVAKERINKKEPQVKTYKLSPKELSQYKEGGPVEKVINSKAETQIAEQLVQQEKQIKHEPTIAHEPIVTKIEEAPQEPVNSYGNMAMTFKLTSEEATSQLEGIIKAINMLGFENLNITIQSEKVA